MEAKKTKKQVFKKTKKKTSKSKAKKMLENVFGHYHSFSL
jgi:hypothetical protein